MLEGCVHVPIDQHQKERVACSWSPIPAADAAAHQMAFHSIMSMEGKGIATDQAGPSLKRTDSLRMLDVLNTYMEGQSLDLLEERYLEGLKHLTMTSDLNCEQLHLAVSCAHLAFRSGLPFREMATSDYGPLLSGPANKPICYLTRLDREKSFTLICKAVSVLLLIERDVANPACTGPAHYRVLGSPPQPKQRSRHSCVPGWFV